MVIESMPGAKSMNAMFTLRHTVLSMCHLRSFDGFLDHLRPESLSIVGYKRRDAHLRSCIGVFNGVYLNCRVARGKALKLSGAGPLAVLGLGFRV